MSNENTGVDLLNLEIDQLLHFFISITSTKAVQYLGAPVHEGQEPVKDLEKAKMAIDSTKAIVDLIKPSLGEDEQKQLDQVVYNLQMAFVSES